MFLFFCVEKCPLLSHDLTICSPNRMNFVLISLVFLHFFFNRHFPRDCAKVYFLLARKKRAIDGLVSFLLDTSFLFSSSVIVTLHLFIEMLCFQFLTKKRYMNYSQMITLLSRSRSSFTVHCHIFIF